MFEKIRQSLMRTPKDEVVPSTEKMIYSLFVRNIESWRAALIPGRLVDMSTMQLPNMATLHSINHFLEPHPIDDINPDIHNPLIVNEKWAIYLQHYLTVPTPTTTPFPVNERYTYVANKYKAQALAFFHNQHKIRRLLSEASVSKLSNALIVSEYAALNHVRLTGQLATYRHFDLILRSMLDHICNSTDKRYHFIQFPLSSRPYTRNQFLKLFSTINTSTLRIVNDPSFFLLIHLLGFVYGETAEPHAKLPQADRDLLPKDVDPPLLTSTSLFARVPDDVLARLHIILTHGNHAIVYNFAELKTMAENQSMFLRVLRHVNALKLINVADELPGEDADDHAFDDAVAKRQGEEVETPEPTPQVAEEPKKLERPKLPVDEPLVTPEKPVVVEKPTVPQPEVKPTKSESGKTAKDVPQIAAYQQHVVDNLKGKLAKNVETHEVTHTKVEELYQRHLAVELGGVSIERLIDTPLPDIHTNKLDFLENHIPEKSMATSSIANFDSLYIEHGMKHDLAKTLTSLVSHGMFVTNIDEIHDHSEWNKRTVYRVALIDVNGKRHSLVFAIPYVSPSGQMMINGVPTRMTKQQINLPICKISDDRVNLSSNYNKTLVERTSTRRHSFSSYFTTYLSSLRHADLVTVFYGKLPDSPTKLPYDYSAVGQTYTRIEGAAGTLIFDYENRFSHLTASSTEALSEADTRIAKLKELEHEYGVFCGTSADGQYLFMNIHNQIRILTIDTDGSISYAKTNFSVVTLLNYWYPSITPPKMISEWTELKILDENFPIIFVLGFRFGLSNILKEHKFVYRWVDAGGDVSGKSTDITIPFADGTMIVPRYPLTSSLILSGLLKYSTKKYHLAEFDSADAYYRILTEARTSSNYLKGINSFFDFFLDPITLDVLQHMHEPTTVAGLLIRANEMLSTYDHYQASSMRNHRLRGYERFSSVLYNEVARQLTAYQNKRTTKRSFSINPEAVFQRIMQDSTVGGVETINPLHEIKGNTSLTYAGSGGRTSKSFVVEDRRYPEDAVGIMSEATPDSGKVAMNAYTSADPKLENIRGMFSDDRENLTPSNVLSTVSMLFPCATQED